MVLKILKSFILFCLLLCFVWLVSTPIQRAWYLSMLGVHDRQPIKQEWLVSTRAGQTKGSGTDPRAIPFARPYQEFEHAPVTFCQADGAKNPSRTRRASIYKWTDDSGIVNFSDKSPLKASNVEIMGDIILQGNEHFSLSLTTEGFEPPALFRGNLNTEILSVFKFFTRYLSPGNLSPVHINLTLIKGERRFAQFRDKHTSGISTNSGFYTSKNNLAAVRWTGKQRTLQVAKHEISHLIIGNLFGNPPTWFNEGLAEFIEHLETRQNASIARVDESILQNIQRKVSRHDLPGFNWLMSTSYPEWEEYDKNLMYQYSWLIIHYLITDLAGKKFIGDYLDHLAKNRCRSFNSSDLFARHFTQGRKGMEREWKHWLLHEPKMPVHF